ncbi:hypothetical protein PV721_22235 [Streptomyces sp. MB09-01]|uniref:hypothetical protein n=1 Tax=Streptomyces sp. MB09-01 TaxID=3028666 RepID=UPI0029BBE694|nr:hypothetical protein [Streptomyces sp. MB09-01]MDX3537043.1 hypothetical protein [Streptomyces sp. MB09-01]
MPVPEETVASVEADVAEIEESALMTNEPATSIGTPTPEELREQVERAHDGLVRTVTSDRVRDRAARASGFLARAVLRAGQLTAEKTPDPVLDKAGRAARAARVNRTPLLGAGAVLVVFFVLVRRGRGRR